MLKTWFWLQNIVTPKHYTNINSPASPFLWEQCSLDRFQCIYIYLWIQQQMLHIHTLYYCYHDVYKFLKAQLHKLQFVLFFIFSHVIRFVRHNTFLVRYSTCLYYTIWILRGTLANLFVWYSTFFFYKLLVRFCTVCVRFAFD